MTSSLHRYLFEVFKDKELMINVTKHELVPAHAVLIEEEKQTLLKRYGLKETELGQIQRGDPVARYAIGNTTPSPLNSTNPEKNREKRKKGENQKELKQKLSKNNQPSNAMWQSCVASETAPLSVVLTHEHVICMLL